MGKNKQNKQRFNKKQSVRFALVPSFDQNGKPITLYRAIQSHKTKLSTKQRQKIIQQISDQQYDQIQINGKKVNQNQIPAFVLQQIKGRKDLIFNQKNNVQLITNFNFNSTNQNKKEQANGDLYQIMDGQYSDQDYYQNQSIDQKDIIDQQYEEYSDYSDYSDMEEQDIDDQQWENQQTQQQKNKQSKPFKLNQEEFPILSKVNIDGKQYQLTQQQIKLLDVLIPQNYQQFQIQGLQFQKYDQAGLPLSQKNQYQQWLATGKEGIVDTYMFVPEKPIDIYDNDLKPSQIKGELKQIQDALNFQGQEDAYQEIQDDFFANMIKGQIQANKKTKKSKKDTKIKKPQHKGLIQQNKLPKQLQKKIEEQSQERNNIFAKYDQLDEQDLNEELTDQMLQKALNDFQNNLQPQNKNFNLNQNKFISKGQNNIKNNKQIQEQQQMQEYQNDSKNNQSMYYADIQNRQEYIGRDGQLDWRCLSKKQKKQYMKTKIIRDFYDQLRQRQIQQKLRGKNNVKAQDLHLKTRVQKLTYEEDHVMRKAIQQDAKQVVDLNQQLFYQTESDEEDIIEYRQRTSVISSNLAQISQPTKKKKKRPIQEIQSQKKSQLQKLSATLSQLKVVPQKRNRQQTSQQRKQRKQKLKQMKKNKKQIKKQFAQKFTQERRKHFKMNKPSDPLHKISYVKIM